MKRASHLEPAPVKQGDRLSDDEDDTESLSHLDAWFQGVEETPGEPGDPAPEPDQDSSQKRGSATGTSASGGASSSLFDFQIPDLLELEQELQMLRLTSQSSNPLALEAEPRLGAPPATGRGPPAPSGPGRPLGQGVKPPRGAAVLGRGGAARKRARPFPISASRARAPWNPPAPAR